VFLEVVEEKIPFVDLPQIFRLVSVEADLVSGNDVKTPAETRQVLVRLNSESGREIPNSAIMSR